jgi:hypothetical protein
MTGGDARATLPALSFTVPPCSVMIFYADGGAA